MASMSEFLLDGFDKIGGLYELAEQAWNQSAGRSES